MKVTILDIGGGQKLNNNMMENNDYCCHMNEAMRCCVHGWETGKDLIDYPIQNFLKIICKN